MNTKQRGRFRIDALSLIQDLDDWAIAMSGLVILHAQPSVTQDATDYVAIGPDFDEIESGALIPEYQAILQWGEEGVIILKEWKKV